jgi:Holliday junction resolvase
VRRIPRRRDANEQSIVDAFTALGWSVQRISAKGAPDLVCARGQKVVFVEVKGAKGKLTKDQVTWHANWRGPKPIIVRTVDDVGRV